MANAGAWVFPSLDDKKFVTFCRVPNQTAWAGTPETTAADKGRTPNSSTCSSSKGDALALLVRHAVKYELPDALISCGTFFQN